MRNTPPYSGPQTRAALENFPFSTPAFPLGLIRAMAETKEAAAQAHASLGALDRPRADALVLACREVAEGKHDGAFVLPALQGGAGTSLHMQVNELLAARATELLGEGTHAPIHPLDDVNRAQSTNDVNPSALRIAALRLLATLDQALGGFAESLEERAHAFRDVPKLARTHLQDAIPTTLGAEFAAYASVMRRDRARLSAFAPTLLELTLGGTATGSGVNVPPGYVEAVYRELATITGLAVHPGENLTALTGSQTDFLALSGLLVCVAVDASKIASDLRLMSSGPQGGLGELRLPPLQAGSTIMPGKANPVLLEVLNQASYLVSGNHTAIELAVRAGQLELNVMWPVIADRLLNSLQILTEVLPQVADRCIAHITANEDRCRKLLEHSTAYATLLAPRLGYDVVAELVKTMVADGSTLRELVLSRGLLTEREFEELIR